MEENEIGRNLQKQKLCRRKWKKMELKGTCKNGNQMEENGSKLNWKEPAKMETRMKKMELKETCKNKNQKEEMEEMERNLHK